MKKLFNVFLFLCLAFFAFALTAGTKVYAEEPAVEPTATSKVTIHYAQFSAGYDDCGLHSWGFGSSQPGSFPILPTSTDEFGAVWEITVDSAASAQMGLIFLKQGVAAGTWDYKSYSRNLFLDTSILSAKGGAYDEIDIYYFENSSKYFIAYPDRANILVVYYDAAGAYEENLGMHIWGVSGAEASGDFDPDGSSAVHKTETLYDGGAVAWASPVPVFVDGIASAGGTKGKATMLYAEAGGTPGGLIYAGDDASKKTASDLFNLTADETTAGSVHTYFVTNGSIYNDPASFFEKAFTFRFVDYAYADETCTGTYAPNPNSIIVVFDSAVAIQSEVANEVTTYLTEGFFKVYEATLTDGKAAVDEDGKPVVGNAVAIKQVDWDKADASSSEFVVQLATPLDNTKDYVIVYDEGAEGVYGYLEVAMDKEGPQIIVPSRAIECEYGVAFEFAKWPSASIVITDNRGGKIMYYCVAGDESKLDTGLVGEQKVKIFAQDAWGNVSTAYITFNVVNANADKGGCNSGAVWAILGALVCASTALVVLRKRNA